MVADTEFFTDDEDELQGPLTMTLCAEDNPVSDLFDDDFYGIDEEELSNSRWKSNYIGP